MRVSDIPEIAKLSTPEKILLVEDLWDSISSDEAIVSIPQSHIDELDRRLKRYESAGGRLLTIEKLQTNIEKSQPSLRDKMHIYKKVGMLPFILILITVAALKRTNSYFAQLFLRLSYP